MSEPAGAEGSIQEFETEVFRALDRYFEVRRREVEESIERVGTDFKNREQARLQPVAATLNPTLSLPLPERVGRTIAKKAR